MADQRRTVGLPTVAMAAIFALVLGSLVTAGPEFDQPGASWPHEVQAGGVPAWQRLREIHEAAFEALPSATAAERPVIERVLRAALQCAAFDGAAPIGEPPPETIPAHAASHTGAATKVEAAWQALRTPPAPPEKPEEWPDWAACADHLEHGHDH